MQKTFEEALYLYKNVKYWKNYICNKNTWKYIQSYTISKVRRLNIEPTSKEYNKLKHSIEKKVGIFGYFGHQNVGDELILESILNSFKIFRCIVFACEPLVTRVTHGLRNVYDKHPRALLTANLCKLLIIGGGGLLHDFFLPKIFTPHVIRKLKTPYILYGIGIPFPEWIKNIGYIIKNAKQLIVRDNISKKFLLSRYPDCSIKLMPDPVFLLRKQNKKLAKRILERKGIDVNKKVIGLQFRTISPNFAFKLPKDINSLLAKNFARLVFYIKSKYGYETILIAFEPRHYYFLRKTFKKQKIVFLDYNDAPMIISGLDFLVGTSLHSIIVASTQNIPFLSINYQSKIEGVNELLETQDRVISISKDMNLCEKFEEFLNKPIDFTERLNKIKRQIKETNRKIIKDFLE